MASWRSAYEGLIDRSFLDAMRAEEQAARWHTTITRHGHSSCVFVAEEADGTVAGFASGGRERDLDRQYLGELYSLYLLPACQRRGLGSQLLRAVAGWLHQHRMDSMLVWVLRDNLPARSFYEHHGGGFLRATRRQLLEIEFEEVSYGWLDTSPIR